MRVLYVEDNPDDAELTRRELGRVAPHLSLDVVRSKFEALAQVQQAAYDVMLCDLNLADGSGLELLAHVRQQQLPTAVVIMTGSGDEGAVVAALRAGADDYVVKKDDYLSRLALILEDALTRYRAVTAGPARPLRVLYVEHDAADIYLTRHHLVRYAPHIHLEVVRTAAEALERLPASSKVTGEQVTGREDPEADTTHYAIRHTYDVIVTDYRLPDLDGLALLKIVYEQRGLRTPAVLVTGFGDATVAAQALRLGVSDYVVKHPGYLFQLPGVLENAFHRAQLAREQALLRQSEARFRLLAENAQDLIYRYEFKPRRGFTYVSPSATRITGYTPEEHYADPDLGVKVVHPEDRDLLAAQSDGAAPGGSVNTEATLRWRRKDGQLIWTEQKNVLTFDEKGELLAIEGIARDITERKQAEQELRRALDEQKQLQFIINHSPAMVWLWRAEPGWPVEFVSDNVRDLGYAPEDFLNGGMGYAQIVHPDDLQRMIAEIDAFVAAGRSEFKQEYRVLTASGEERWVADHTWVRRSEDGEVTHLQGICLDITETRRADAALRRSEANLRAMFQHSPQAVVLVSPTMKVQTFNEVARQRVRTLYDQELAIGDSMIEYIRPQYRQGFQQRFHQALAGQTAQIERSVESGGENRWHLYQYAPVLGEDGQVMGVLFITTDITESKRAEEAIAAQERFVRSTLDALSSHICVLDAGGVIVAVNRAWQEFARANPLPAQDGEEAEPAQTGLESGFLGANYLAVCDASVGENSDEAAAFAAGIRAVMAGERDEFSLEYPCHAPAEQRWFVGRVTRFAGPGPVRVVIAHENISERKLAEQALQHHDHLLETAAVTALDLLRTADLGVAVERVLRRLGEETGSDRVYVFENRVEAGASRLLTSQRYEWVRPGVSAQIDNPDRQDLPMQELAPRWAATLGAGEVIVGNAADFPAGERAILAAQDIRSILVVPILMHGGFWGFLGFDSVRSARDWTAAEETVLRIGAASLGAAIERSRTEQALQQSTLELDSYFSNALDLLCIAELDGTFRRLNREWETALGYSPDELLGRRFWEFVHPDDVEATLAVVADLEAQKPVLNFVNRYRRRDGSYCWIEWRAFATGNVIYAAARDISGRIQAEQTLQRRLQELTLLHAVTLAGTEAADVNELIGRVTRLIGESLYPDNFGVLLLDEGNQVLHAHPSYRGMPQEALITEIPLSQGVVGQVARSGQRLRLADVRQNPHYVEVTPPTRSELAVPIMIGSRVLGVINAESNELDHFTANDERLLGIIAGALATALEQLRLREAERRHNERLSLLNQISRALSSTLDAETLYAIAHREIARLLDCPNFGIFRYDEAQQLFVPVYIVGDHERLQPSQLPPPIPLEPGTGIKSEAVLTRQPVVVEDVQQLRAQFKTFKTIPTSDPRPSRAQLVAPMIAGDRVTGIVEIQSYNASQYTAADAELLSGIGHQLALAMQNAELFAITNRRRQEAETLRQAANTISASIELDQVLDAVLAFLPQVIPCDTAAVFLIEGEQVRVMAAAGHPDLRGTVGQMYPAKSSLFAEIANTRQPLILADAQADPRFQRWAGTDYVRGWMGLPLIARNEVTGFVTLDSLEPGVYDASMADLAQAVAHQAAAAIENARLHAQTKRRLQYLTAIRDIDAAISASLDLHSTLDILLQHVTGRLEVDATSVLLYNPQQQRLRFVTGVGFECDHTDDKVLQLGESMAGRAALERRTVHAGSEEVRLLEEVELLEPESDPPFAALWAAEGFQSYYGVPLLAKGEVKGVLEVFHRRPFTPDREWLDFLDSLAGLAAIAIDNALLFSETQRRLDELEVVSEVAVAGAAGDLFDAVVARATQALSRLWPGEAIGFLFVDPDGKTLRLHPSAYGIPDEIATSLCVVVGESIVGWAAAQKEAMRLGDVRSDPRYLPILDEIRSEMVAPLLVDEQVIGVAWLQSTTANAFTDDDLRLLRTLAGQFGTLFAKAQLDAALAVERGLLAERVETATAELSATNAALVRASRAKDEFLATMSHELRTPLTSVLALSEALQKEVYGPLTDKQLKSLRTINESGQHLLSLINDILDLAKIEAGHIELLMEPVLVDQVCQASLRLIAEMAARKEQPVSYSMRPASFSMRTDARRLKQILVNLLSNATKFTPKGRALGLEVEADEQRRTVRFTVWDHGIGIAGGDMGKLFVPFQQVHTGLARDYAGTGLGLALVQRLVEMHGGSVSVQSTPAEGSRFTIALPWIEAKPMAQPAGLQHPSQPSGQPRRMAGRGRIMAVDDTEATLQILTDFLQTQGYEVVTAAGGREALDRMRELEPDLILLDIQMPEMDGLEVIRRLRSHPGPGGLSAVPIVALTALAMPGDRERCLAAGADEYLSKPVILDDLLQTIDRLERGGSEINVTA